MESIHKILLPYKDLIGYSAGIITILHCFSGIFVCKDIYKQKSTKNISAIPFVGGVVLGVLMLKYGIMLKDDLMYDVNVVTIGLNVIYMLVYFIYSTDLYSELIKPSRNGLGLIIVLFIYTAVENEHKVEYRFGLIVTLLLLLLIASPLLEVQEIMRKKDASSIPFPITLSTFVVSVSWLLYGIVLMNDFMIIQNLTGIIMCLTQLALIAVFPKKEHTKIN